MLQRMKESSDPLSPASMLLPVSLTHPILSLEEDYHQCKINHGEKSLPRDLNKLSWSMHEKSHQGTSAFRFSISRLPKWAQSKITGSESVHGDALAISSEIELKVSPTIVSTYDGYDSVHPEVQTPKHDMRESNQCLGAIFSSSSDTDCSGSSSIPPEIHSNFSMDKRWLTIHTVCLDLLNSPEILDLRDMTMPMSSPHLLQSMAVKTPSNNEYKEISSRGHTVAKHFSAEHPLSHDNHVVDDGPKATSSGYTQHHIPGSMLENSDQLHIHNASACYYDVIDEGSALLQSNATESRVQTDLDFKSQDNDLFNQHFSNLSTIPKTEGRKSSSRRRFSTRFVVRRDRIEHCSGLCETSIKDLGSETLNCQEESSPHSIFKHLESTGLEEPQLTDAFEQAYNCSTQGLLSSSRTHCQSECFVQKNLLGMEVREVMDQKECINKGTEMEVPIVACKKALVCLDAAVESALQIFSNLGSMVSREEISSGPEADLCDLAAKLLPSITQKVNAIANLVQASKNDLWGKTGKEVSTLEPVLRTFAENLS